ncbi:hypothetical protein K8T06_11450, partial [bacterium]|nr:hypothetical protein [bacterium]
MKTTLSIILVILLFASLCSADDYSQDNFFNKLKSVQNQEAADEIFSDFMHNSPDLEFAHKLYSMWGKQSPDAAKASMELLKQTPENAGRLQYFEGANLESEFARIEYARNIIESDKDAFEAYALMFDTYTRNLFMKPFGFRKNGPSEDELRKLDDGFSQDNLKMVRIREWKKAGEHLLL